jgi:WD40 repeat protein
MLRTSGLLWTHYVLTVVATVSLLGCVSKTSGEPARPPGESAPVAVAAAGQMTVARSVHTSTLLRNGQVLIAGGMQRDEAYLDTAELYDPRTGAFTPTGRMNAKRVGPVALPLGDGRVLFTGGINESGSLRSAEIYDPATGRFTPTGDMVKAREAHALVPLKNGLILVAGGLDNRRGVAEAELYNPADGTFRLTGSMKTPRGSVVAAPLPDGRVLVCGGTSDLRTVLDTAEIYDPSTGAFSATANMQQRRFKFAANALADGRVLLTGGAVDDEWSGRRPTAEIFDPRTGKFSAARDMNQPRFKHTTATALLPDGRVLIAGGNRKVEVFDPKAGTFSLLVGDLGDEFYFNSVTVLADGRVLLTGGYSASRPGPPTPTAKAWVITAS